MSDVHDRLRQQRLQHKMTQRAVAEAVGMGVDSVSKHESGRMGVSAEAFKAYARLYGVTVDYLAGEAELAAQQTAPTPRAGRDVGVPMAVARLLSSGRCNPVDDAEIAHLAWHIGQGNSQELDDLEIHLLAYRAERDRTEEAGQRFLQAVRRGRGGQSSSSVAASKTPASNKTLARKPEPVSR